jgi:hypothetical protein
MLETMTDRYPEWRLGQLVANLAAWARQPTEQDETAIWDVEDEELLLAIKRHLAQRDASPRQGGSATMEKNELRVQT